MTKHSFAFAAAMLAALGVSAAPLTPAQALQRFAAESPRRAAAMQLNQLKLAYSPADQEEPALYVFARPAEKGFIVLSGDDCAPSLLGYSDNGTFEAAQMAPSLRYWLDCYSDQIEMSRITGRPAQARVADNSSWQPIAPLVKTTWNQDAPYYNDCPKTTAGQQTYTGCVATSTAQVMNYFKYPEIGEGYQTYRCSTLARNLSLNMGKKAFDWDNMLDNYSYGQYTQEQANAVAYLMKAVGYAVEMQYGTNASGAISSRIAPGLIEFFKYDPSAAYYTRDQYSYDEWAKMIYDNLAKIGPVIYDGTSLEGGHSFVCDGYDGEGYFHFNWGWGGMSDGYFLLDALDPGAQGIGGTSAAYTFGQDAVLGLQPLQQEPLPKHPDNLTQFGSLTSTVNGNILQFGLYGIDGLMGWANMEADKLRFSMGLIVENLSDPTDVRTLMLENYQDYSLSMAQVYKYDPENPNPYIIPKADLSKLDWNLNTTYRLTLGAINLDYQEAGLQPLKVEYGYWNSINLTPTATGYDNKDFTIADYNVTSFQLENTLYYGCPAKLKATISNPSELQLSKSISPVLLNEAGEVVFQGEVFMLTLDPGQSVDYDWISMFINMTESAVNTSTEFTLALMNYNTKATFNREHVIDVTMNKNPGTPTVIGKLTLPGVEQNPDGIYQVTDPHNIPLNYSLKIGKGYFAYPVTAYIMRLDPANPSYLLFVVTQPFSEIPFLEGGENTLLETSFDFVNYDPTETYYLQCGYSNGGRITWLKGEARFMVKDSGIDSVDAIEGTVRFAHNHQEGWIRILSADPLAAVRLYDMSGTQLTADTDLDDAGATVYTSNLPTGLLLITVTDAQGRTHTAKIRN